MAIVETVDKICIKDNTIKADAITDVGGLEIMNLCC